MTTKDLQHRPAAEVGTVASLKKEMTPVGATTSAAARRENWKQAVASLDSQMIERARELMNSYIDSMVTISPDDEVVLSDTQRNALMNEDLMRREITDLIESRKETIKELVFQAITEDAARAGADDPELTNGEIVVEEQGRRFTREGAGYSAPTFNIKTLKAALGDDADLVITRQTKVVEEVDEEALNGLLAGNPELIEKVRAAMTPGKVRKGSFYNRPIR